MSLPQELIEIEIGRAVCRILEKPAIFSAAAKAAQSAATQILEEIQVALSEPDLDDFQYVEAIVEILHHHGISTTCHDF